PRASAASLTPGPPKRNEAVGTVGTEIALGWYAYCIVAATAGELSSWPAAIVPTHGLERIEQGPLAALVSRVPLADFDEDALRARLNDTEWLEPAIRVHENVVERALGSAAVIPFRFCTIYRTDIELRRFL